MSIVYKDNQITLTEWTAHFDQMCWPRNGKYLGDLNWKLRYGEPNKSDMLVAAEVIGAYMALIDKPASARTKIVRLLKLAEELAAEKQAPCYCGGLCMCHDQPKTEPCEHCDR